MGCRFLVALDFDHTIIDGNSHEVVTNLIPSHTIPKALINLARDCKWMEYMSELFKLLHSNKVRKNNIIGEMQKMSPTQNMIEFMFWLNAEGHETIIISDSNSVFICEWLRHWNVSECIKRVFTNPACFDESELLTVTPYQDQDWCNMSTKNLCKGYVLETYIRERQQEGEKFDSVVYVGDGQNDFCPSLKLKENDFVFPRAGFPLEKLIKNPPKEFPFEGKQVIAKVYPWVSARNIIHYLKYK